MVATTGVCECAKYELVPHIPPYALLYLHSHCDQEQDDNSDHQGGLAMEQHAQRQQSSQRTPRQDQADRE